MCVFGFTNSPLSFYFSSPSNHSSPLTLFVHTLLSFFFSDQYWEGGDENTVARFTDNADCQQAYKNFLCFMNFPRCDDTGQSLILCRSVCENFFRACKYESFLNRCYNPEFYGSTYPEPETITDELGLPIYMRAHLPGQPFRDILIDEESEEMKIVCTPSIPGAGVSILLQLNNCRSSMGMLMFVISTIVLGVILTVVGSGG